MPAAGLLGFGAAAAAGLAAAGVPPTAGAPHPAAAHPLLKPDLHSARESVEVKRPGSNSNEERLVSKMFFLINILVQYDHLACSVSGLHNFLIIAQYSM